MSSLGPIQNRTGYGGGSGGQSFSGSQEEQKKKNMNLFDNSSGGPNRHRRNLNRPSAKPPVTHTSPSDIVSITDIEDLMVTKHDELVIDGDINNAILNEDLLEEDLIVLNYNEFSDNEETPTSGDRLKYINMIVNNYLKHIMVFCILVVAVSVFAFFILSYINGF